jgi:hypothetical protein
MGFFYALAARAIRRRRRSIVMTAHPDQLVVSDEDHAYAYVHSSCVHHRYLPEVRGEGPSPEDAAARLALLLSRSLDDAPSGWRREIIQQALEDVRAFVEQSR